MKLYRDYNLIGDMLFKAKLDERKHLLWQFGGVPAIDAYVWDEYRPKIKRIRFNTSKSRVFRALAEDFDKHKQEIDFGWGRQYYMAKEHWRIDEFKKPGPAFDYPSEKESEDREKQQAAMFGDNS